jgi:sugar lactone lactonase YvrE
VGGVVSSSSTVITLSIGASNSFNGFSYPTGVAVDGSGNVYVADNGNSAVEEIMAVGGVIPASPTINTLGSGFSSPQGVAVDGSGNVYVADTGNNAVKEIVAGTGGAASGTVSSGSTVVTLASGPIYPTGVAVDGGGNVYVADTNLNNYVGTVEEIVAGTGGATSGTVSSGSTVLTLSGNFNGPSGVAVDGSGNVYGSDSYDSLVKEIDLSDAPSLSFASTAVGSTSSDSPQTVTLNNSGNAALSFPAPNSGNNPSISPNFILDGANTCPVTASGASSPGSLAQGTSCTVAIDFAPVAAGSITGSLIFTDNSTVPNQTISLSGTALSPYLAFTPTPSIPAVGSSAGIITVSVEDPYSAVLTGSSNPVTLTVTGPNSYSQSYGPINATSGVVSFDTSANLLTTPGIYTFTATSGAYTAAIATVLVNNYIAPTEPVSTASTTQTATINFVNTFTLGSVSVVTQGATGLDYAFVSGGTCISGFAASPTASCTVLYTFTPKAPGARYGAIVVSDGTPTVQATVYLTGTGTGPLATFSIVTGTSPSLNYNPSTQSMLGSGFTNPSDIAVDSSGNVYVINGNGGTPMVYEIMAVNGVIPASPTINTLGSGWSNPIGVAVDGAGNIYVADYSFGLMELPAGCASTSCVSIPMGGTGPGFVAVAVDGVGNVYALNYNSGSVAEMPPGCATSSCVTTLAGGFSSPRGLAVDGSGNVYVADTGNGVVKEVVAVGGVIPSSPTINTLGRGFSIPQGVALDVSGNVYVADIGNSVVYEIVAVGGVIPTSPTINTLGSGLSGQYGVEVDGSGNVYVADQGSSVVYELNYATPPTLTFATPTTSGTLNTTDNPQTATLQNIGNAALTFPVPGSDNNPSISTNFTLDSSNTCPVTASRAGSPGSLAQAASCTVAIDFAPVAAGSISGSLVFTDNSAVATQTISLSGTATQQTPTFGTMSFSPAATEAYGISQIITITDTLVYTGSGAVPAGAVTVVLNGVSYTASCTGSSSPLTCTYAVPAATIAALPATAYTVTAAYTADSNYTAATGASGTFTIAQAQAITFTPPTSPVTFGVSPITLTATGGGSGNAVTFSIVSGGSYGSLSGTNNSVLTVTGAGAIVIAADQAGNSNYAAATAVQQSIVVNTAAQTINFTQPTSPVTYGISPITLTATGGASGLPVVFSIVSGGSYGSLSGTNNSVLTVTGAGAIVIAANQAGNSNYAAATQATASVAVNASAQTITFTPPTSPVAFGVSPITLTATGGASGLPVVFSIVSGPGSITGSTLTVTGAGTIVIAANQAGNTNYAAATQVTQSVVVNTATQTIAFTPSTPVIYGVSPITLAATGGASGNLVVFTIVSGPGSITGSTLTVTGAGTIVIAANQAGNTNYAAATQVTASIVVNTATQAITFTPPTTPVAYGTSPITLTATGGASGLPVVFSIVSGPGSITGSTLSVTGAGAIVIAANQAGNTNYAAATQVTRSVVVNLATPTVATVSAVTSAYGSTTGITVTATESGSAGVVTGGVVTFSVISPATGIFTLATCTLSAAGACTATYTPTGTLAAGTYAGDIKASFATVGNYAAASGAAMLTVSQVTPGITLAASVNPTVVQSAITFTATVTSAIGMPTGTVIFMDGTTLLGTGAIVNGVATFTTSTLAVGAHTITAVYSSDNNFTTVTSSAQTETVLDFSLNISAGTGTGSVTSATVQPGGTAVFTVTISPVGSTTFPATITLSASGLPPGATYVISPATLVAGSGTQTVTLTIQLPPSIAALHHGNGMNQIAPFALALLFLPFAGLMRKHAKRLGRMTWIVLLLIASAATMAGVTGCGGFFVQPPATYTVSLTGTSGNLSYSTPLTLTVE